MTLLPDLSALQTEGSNPKSARIDQVSTYELCSIINREDSTVAATVGDPKCISVIAAAIDALADRVRRGGRVIYVGAGTSGRLGVLDASEIPPTYSAPHEQFVALMAGGDAAMRIAQEGAEDSLEAPSIDLTPLNLDPELDSLIGIAASGRTPYVLGCLEYAKREVGCVTIGVACSTPSAMGESGVVDYMIEAVTGPEVVTGSTRMKAGTATKLVLNMLSTGVMIKVGKTYGNMMVDLKASNLKLQQRSRNIIRKLGGPACPTTDAEIDALLASCNGSVKLVLATLGLEVTVDEARERLDDAGGSLSSVLKSKNQEVAKYQDDEMVLYVDGGGTKCAAVIMGRDSRIGEGEAGPCNVVDISLDSAISSIELATQRALDSFQSTTSAKIDIRSARFKSIWIGIAGYDRPEVKSRMDSALSDLFTPSPGKTSLTITHDIEAIGTAIGNKTKVDNIIVLIAGTGSVAMNYQRQNESLDFIRRARSGGWGHLLGDDGGGFDLGRQGIRRALTTVDEFNANSGIQPPTDPLPDLILQHFGLPPLHETAASDNIDLLSRIITDTNPQSTNFVDQKSKVAAVAQIILTSYETSASAREIIALSTASLARILRLLIPRQQAASPQATFDLSSTTLVLGGSLLSRSKVYREALLTELGEELKFKHVEVVEKPADVGAGFLRGRDFSV
ncbi:hypothetical protein FQN54_007391 [Arachnomyces sp. PD_36]|nr:hypothetical protein FQN54_007391 [Arachnomyces sp. PD_36]